MALTQRDEADCGAIISNRPTCTAKRAPKTLEVGNRQPGRPGVRVIVRVDGTAVLATAGEHPLPRHRRCRRAPVSPRAIAAETAHRRPIRHRGRRRGVEPREDARCINDSAADDRQLGDDVSNCAFGAREIIPVGDDQVGQLPDLDPSLLVLFVGEPGDILGL